MYHRRRSLAPRGLIHPARLFGAAALLVLAVPPAVPGGEAAGAAGFHRTVEPLLRQYCSDCHMDGMHKGNVAFDEFGSEEAVANSHELWFKVLKNLRAGLMPPRNRPRPAPPERASIENWIKFEAFGIDPNHPDPGRVTVRRLNRVEYRNTIRDLLGVDFDTENEFPPDDTGYGFDDIGDVLTLSPMLLEKYLSAAERIVRQALPTAGKSGPEGDIRHARFFPRPPPDDPAQRRDYAAELLEAFATRAFRRPAGPAVVQRLAALAEQVYTAPGQGFEAGIAQAMVAVLASPRFLFREEQLEPAPAGSRFALLDEYSLASRLSYFLWSSMPDEELVRLAGARQLRRNLEAQVRRMMADPRRQGLIRNFSGQWLQARDIETVALDARSVLLREEQADPERDRRCARLAALRQRQEATLAPGEKDELARLQAEFRQRPQQPLHADLTRGLRRAMRLETEMYFDYVVREDRPLLELLESDYTFLNEGLAKHYGIPGVAGDELRLVKLPAGCVRGGILTQATILAVTSNPTRTSPVKRGRFLLDAILGAPAPPPPPNIPPLEAATKDLKGRQPSLRETLELHRAEPSCGSCHNRLDPLGLAFESFNALGMWRDQELGQPIDSTGNLITGESFHTVRELKHILAANHAGQFYRCLTEKLLTYALGRGLDYHDVHTVDEIVARLERANGRFSALLFGIIDSAPFQEARTGPAVAEQQGHKTDYENQSDRS